jgi:Tfp pilus assembly protein PilF
LGQLDQAEDTLDTVLQIDPSHARVWFRRGEIHMTRGEYERAIQAFKTAKKRGVRKKHVVAKIRECEQRLNEQ